MPREVYKLSASKNIKDLERQLNTLFSRLTVQLQRIEGLDGAVPQIYGNINMNNNKLTSLGAGTAVTDSINKGQSHESSIGAALVSSGVLTIDANIGEVHRHSMTEDITTLDFTNISTTVITNIALIITQHASSAKILNHDTVTGRINGIVKTIKSAGGSGTILSSVLGSISIFNYIIDPGANVIYQLFDGADFA